MTVNVDVKKTLNALNGRDHVVEDWKNNDGSQWYRKWASGLIECGVTRTGATTNDWSGEVSLPVAFSSDKYDVLAQVFKTDKNGSDRAATSDVFGKTTTSVFCGWFFQVTAVNSIYVYARGY